MRYSKYSNKKSIYNGMTFDSKKELCRYKELLLLKEAGEIQNLQTQVKFVLIPTQRDTSTEVYKKGVNKGKLKPGKVIEKECCYIADFVYSENGKMIVEDTKGVKTKEYIIKRKLMLYTYGIRIKEI